MQAAGHSSVGITFPPQPAPPLARRAAAGMTLIILTHTGVSDLSASQKTCILKGKHLTLGEYFIAGLSESLLGQLYI